MKRFWCRPFPDWLERNDVDCLFRWTIRAGWHVKFPECGNGIIKIYSSWFKCIILVWLITVLRRLIGDLDYQYKLVIPNEYVDQKAQLPWWLPRAQQVPYKRWIWRIHWMQLTQNARDGAILALKPRVKITRSPKQGYQWSQKKDSCPSKINKSITSISWHPVSFPIGKLSRKTTGIFLLWRVIDIVIFRLCRGLIHYHLRFQCSTTPETEVKLWHYFWMQIFQCACQEQCHIIFQSLHFFSVNPAD